MDNELKEMPVVTVEQITRFRTAVLLEISKLESENAELTRRLATYEAKREEEINMDKAIEVIDQYNAKHRFPEQTHHYEWRLKPGTLDEEGADFLDIFSIHEDDESELVATFPHPAKVGIMFGDETFAPVFRELELGKCPRCGYIKLEK